MVSLLRLELSRWVFKFTSHLLQTGLYLLLTNLFEVMLLPKLCMKASVPGRWISQDELPKTSF